jgi:hypothetical protein
MQGRERPLAVKKKCAFWATKIFFFAKDDRH